MTEKRQEKTTLEGVLFESLKSSGMARFRTR